MRSLCWDSPSAKLVRVEGQPKTPEVNRRLRRLTMLSAMVLFCLSISAPCSPMRQAFATSGAKLTITFNLASARVLPSVPEMYLEVNRPFTSPGETTVAVIALRTDLPPFTGGNLSQALLIVKVNPTIAAADCHAPPDMTDPSRTQIGGHTFESVTDSDAAMMKSFYETYSYGFVDGTCYQVSRIVSVISLGVVDGMRHIETAPVDRLLRNLQESIRFEK
jgi:hypothetical protein